MVGLPATGELTYNGYTFDGASQIRVEVQFVYDDADRNIIADRHVINVSAIVANDSGLNRDIFEIRRRLGQPGKPMRFHNKGFGNDLIVSGDAVGRTSDVRNGPLPRVLSFEPIGDDKAARIEWSVEVTVPRCTPGTSFGRGVLALNYSIDYRIQLGYTTRTISGYIQVAQKAGRTASDTADAYRDSFVPGELEGFKREVAWLGNLDKSRVDFRIVDEEIRSPNAYPPRVLAIEGRHRQSWRRRNSKTMPNTISVTITPDSGITGAQAWQIFLTIAIRRMKHALARGRPIFIDALDVEENLFDVPQSFTVRYRMLSCLRDFVDDAGLWEPIGADWGRWRQSLAHSMFSNRGKAQLRDVPGNDIVVDICNTPLPFVSPNNLQLRTQIARERRSPGLRNETPPEDQSWLEYEQVYLPKRRKPVVRQPILQSPGEDEGAWEIDRGTPTTQFSFGSSGGVTADVIQEGGAPRHSLRVMGKAKRAGHKIPRPVVKTWGGRNVTETNFLGYQRTEGNYFGVPVYEGKWAIDYVADSSPGVVEPPNDELECVRSGVAQQPDTNFDAEVNPEDFPF